MRTQHAPLKSSATALLYKYIFLRYFKIQYFEFQVVAVTRQKPQKKIENKTAFWRWACRIQILSKSLYTYCSNTEILLKVYHA